MTSWDETAGVQYSLNNTDVKSELSDYVWVQVEVNTPLSADTGKVHLEAMYIHFESD